ncbi:unnamed protein product [Psylliodes chrysocephalus]|uniref:acid phosphatase n=1 Tax=Psylliodes chrysocephalus TaxID=3402493 RepID=A0A9P0G6U5_9CUCU|nr:unnamed protein product [Psylliodes chrysocephala]
MVFKAACFMFTIAVAASSNDNLIAVVQVFRHGQRTPVYFSSTDPYKDIHTYWDGLDYGQLTNEGKREHYALGQFSRKRYADWLPEVYNKKDIYVQTTDYDRTHMSAQANLNGLYPPKGSDVWRKNVDWQPIPVHPADPRKIFNGRGESCPLYNNLSAKAAASEEFANLNNIYASMFQYISKHTNSTSMSMTKAVYIYDSLHIEEQVGYPLPSWTQAVYPEPLSTLAASVFEQIVYYDQMKKLFIGILLNDIIEHFEGIIADPTSLPKYQMISCHDSNIFSILSSVGNRPAKPVPFAVSLWFELRRVNFNNVVQLWLRSNDKLTQLSIKGCELNCPLTKVKTLLSDILIDLKGAEALCSMV